MEFHAGLARALLDGFPLSIAVLDEEGEIVWVNRAWREYGRDHGLEGESVGREYLDVTAVTVRDPYAGRIGVGIREILGNDGAAFSMEYPCHDERELEWYSVRASAVEIDGVSYCLVAHEEVTERKVTDLLTEARREESATLNRMLTHEVRNAVGSAVGWLRMLDIHPDQVDRVERVAASLERIEAVVRDSNRVLELARGRPSFERIPIEDLATAAWERGDRGDVTLEFVDRFPVICYPRQTEALLESLFDSVSAASGVTTARVRLGDRVFHVEDDRSEPVPTNPERAFAETPVHRDSRLSFGLSLARPLALLNGWRLSLGPSPLGGWGFTVRTDQLHV